MLRIEAAALMATLVFAIGAVVVTMFRVMFGEGARMKLGNTLIGFAVIAACWAIGSGLYYAMETLLASNPRSPLLVTIVMGLPTFFGFCLGVIALVALGAGVFAVASEIGAAITGHKAVRGS
jgi:hypothetical protein